MVWGTGMLTPVRNEFLPHVTVAAVRGPLTVALLEIAVPLGDPGLLVSDLLDSRPEPDGRIGIVLHHSQTMPADLASAVARDARFRVIDVADEDHMGVVAAIAACAHVYSSSLHGLILANAFGVPSTWLDVQGIHKSAAFKFYDYALSIGRLLNAPMPLDAILEHAAGLPDRFETIAHLATVVRVREGLCAAFPAEIMAQAV